MSKQIINPTNFLILPYLAMLQYVVLMVCHFQVFLCQFLVGCPFDRLYALKPKNPE
ncbi:MAG: hypothetical protein J7577_01750 [Sphingobacteriaceae bacterium]|nr:hypothetical protein [Sphingobacteriaceae bacterium]